jgi:hypothetical protein
VQALVNEVQDALEAAEARAEGRLIKLRAVREMLAHMILYTKTEKALAGFFYTWKARRDPT